MDASKFLKGYIRMCTSIPCSKCALYETSSCLDDVGDNSTPEDIELLVSAVDKWSKEHPVITNREVFRKTFGDEQLHGIENIIGNTRNEGVANALSAFLDREYEEIKGENDGIHED